MRNLLCFVAVVLFLQFCTCEAKSEFSETLSKLEKNLLGIEYTNQKDLKRVERLENNIYGEISKGSLSTRISKMTKDLHSEMFGQEIAPKKDTFDEEENYFTAKEKADAGINYPILDELEKRVFNKNFKSNSLEKRLANLETKTFSKIYSNDDFNKRTERLKMALLPKIDDDLGDYDSMNFSNNDSYKRAFKNPFNKAPLSQQESTSSDSDYDYPQNDLITCSDVNIPLAQLEKKILKRTYKNEEPSTRLVRLETKIFSTTFTQDDIQTRLDRIASVYQASKSTNKYDDGKTAQRIATAMQIGTFILMILATIL